MIKTIFSCFCIFVFLFCNGCSSGGGTAVPTNNVPDSIEQQAQLLSIYLKSQGYEVSQGYFKLYTQDDCPYSYALMQSCYGNNPAAPYIEPVFKSWPDEFIDPATSQAFGQTPDGYSSVLRLDPREAIVVFGIMPPPAAYFGMQTYLFTREGTFDTTSSTYQFIANNFPTMLGTFFTPVPQNPARIQLVASLGNSNNNVIMQEQSGEAFSKEIFFITTPDQFMDSAIREALNTIGVESNTIFTEPIPSGGGLNTVKTGLDQHADDLIYVMRYAMPQDDGESGSLSDTWKKDLPMVLLRVRDPSSTRTVQTYDAVTLETRTAINESSLQTDLTNLVAAVNNRWGQPCAQTNCSDQGTINFVNLQPPPINFVGPLCMLIGMNCLGDTQDTSYQTAVGQLSINNGEIYAVASTLGTITGNATYVGLSINDSVLVEGVVNISDDQLQDSAASYAGQVNNTDKLYLYYFTRDCSVLEALTDGNCFSITEDMIPQCTDPATQTCHDIKIAQRNYIVPGTRRGPDSTLIQLPRLLKLNR
ncbi:MAG: hypothetical protein ABH859_08160 [Pseudomonadota bacterium]